MIEVGDTVRVTKLSYYDNNGDVKAFTPIGTMATIGDTFRVAAYYTPKSKKTPLTIMGEDGFYYPIELLEKV